MSEIELTFLLRGNQQTAPLRASLSSSITCTVGRGPGCRVHVGHRLSCPSSSPDSVRHHVPLRCLFLGPGHRAPFTPVHAGLPALLSLSFFAAAAARLVLCHRCRGPVWHVLCVHVPVSWLEGGFLSTGGAVQPLPGPGSRAAPSTGEAWAGGWGRVGLWLGPSGKWGGSPLLPTYQPLQGTLSWVLS